MDWQRRNFMDTLLSVESELKIGEGQEVLVGLRKYID